MELYFKSETIKAIRKAGVKSTVFGEDGMDWRDREIDSKFILTEDFEVIRKVVSQPGFGGHIENRRILRKLDAVESLQNVKAGATVKNLEAMAEAIRNVIAPTPHKWVFLADGTFGSLVPYYVTRTAYHPPQRRKDDYTPAYVSVSLEALRRGEEKRRSFSFYRENLPATVEELLGAEEVYIETPKMVADYEAELKKYQKESPRTGEQYLAHGRGETCGAGRWSQGNVEFEKDGEAARVVMDDGLEQGKRAGMTSSLFWSDKHVRDDADEDDSEKMVPLPVHPIVRVFNLGTHDYVDCHIANLDEYVYDPDLIDKLVLPKAHKELVDALTGSAIKKMDDIIKGKAQGIIVLSSGKPGTGKTLTAEVYSEVIKRPLYTVQCSQLGTDSDQLEKLLSEVLERATRWRALLLIDEADVYIHERGANIQQNAIVGVFLRLLEYYKGILFLTTNRDTIVDDAIVSRVTAHIRYGIPETKEDTERLWTVLCKQYGVELGPRFLTEAMRDFPGISGRSIRQLIRLGKFMADKEGKPLGVGHLRQAAKFHDFTEREEIK